MLLVVGSSLLGGNHTHFHTLDLQTSTLEAVNDLADVAVANTVGLDHAVGLFNCHVGSFQMSNSLVHISETGVPESKLSFTTGW